MPLIEKSYCSPSNSNRRTRFGNLKLSQLGVYLDPVVLPGDDALLTLGTKFAIADYQDGNDLSGFFMRDDKSLISEGGLITEGLNTFRLSYSDPDYSPGTSSIITLTTVPEPSTGILAAIGLLGCILTRRIFRI